MDDADIHLPNIQIFLLDAASGSKMPFARAFICSLVSDKHIRLWILLLTASCFVAGTANASTLNIVLEDAPAFTFFDSDPSDQEIVTDHLASYKAALRDLGATDKQQTRRWLNNRVENTHLPFRQRERAQQRFRQMRSLQRFAAVHSSVYNHFNHERSHTKRDSFKETRTAALEEWRGLGAA